MLWLVVCWKIQYLCAICSCVENTKLVYDSFPYLSMTDMVLEDVTELYVLDFLYFP